MDSADDQRPRRRIRLMGREFTLPRSRKRRIAIGAGLVFLGMLGFLPVLGFWMIPLGLLVLSYDFASVRRRRRKTVLWWERRKQKRGGTKDNGTQPPASDG